MWKSLVNAVKASMKGLAEIKIKIISTEKNNQ